jgi:hypothetical protein
MKLSNDTMDVLKNFAVINSNIAFTTDQTLKTVAVSKNIMAKAGVSETFPYEFGVYDLPEFLSAMGMFEEPELTFDDNKKFVTLSNGTSSIKYFFSDISNLVIPGGEPKMPDVAVSFELTGAQLNTIRKASAALKADQLVIEHTHVGTKNDDGVELTVTDVKNPTSNEFKLSVKTDINNDTDFKFVLNIGNFKFSMSDSYKFEISSKLIASVTAADTQYWLALEKSSK